MKPNSIIRDLTLFMFIIFTAASSQSVYHVNAAVGNNSTGTGSAASPYKTITKALSVSAAEGDSIKVAPGTYNSALGETFPIEMLSGRKLIGSSGPGVTIIDAAGSKNRVFNCLNNSNSTIIQGFTITGGYAIDTTSGGVTSKGGGIFIGSGSQPIIQQNIITKNTARGYDFYQAGLGALNGGSCYGGGIYVAGAPTIRNNVISFNLAYGGGGQDFRGGWSGNGSAGGNADGGGIHAAFGGASVIVNNTFYGNKAAGGFGGSSNSLNAGNGGNASAGALNAGSNTTVTNNIFVNNEAAGGTVGGGANGSNGTSSDGALTSFSAGNCSYNLYFNNTAGTSPNGSTLGANALLTDPLFVSASDYHLQQLSPARKAGTPSGAPTKDLDGTLRSNPPSIGAFEGSAPTSVLREGAAVLTQFALIQNYPNPFNPATTIGFILQASGLTSLTIYDAIGREVATLANEYLEAGVVHQRMFDASQRSAGFYIARLQSGRQMTTLKIVLLK
ncbi:MAG: T9SS type A sorting domain-containing protein [Bacteroidota bacterium]